MTFTPEDYNEKTRQAIVDLERRLLVKEISRNKPLSEFTLPPVSGRKKEGFETFSDALTTLSEREAAVRHAHAELLALSVKRTDIRSDKRDAAWPMIKQIIEPLPNSSPSPLVEAAVTDALNDHRLEAINLRPIRMKAEEIILGSAIQEKEAQLTHTESLKTKQGELRTSRRKILKTRTILTKLREMHKSGEYKGRKLKNIQESISQLERRLDINHDPEFRSDVTTASILFGELARLSTLIDTLHNRSQITIGRNPFVNPEKKDAFDEKSAHLTDATKQLNQAINYLENPLRELAHYTLHETNTLVSPGTLQAYSVDIYDQEAKQNESITVWYGAFTSPESSNGKPVLTPIHAESVRYKAVPYQTEIPFNQDETITLGDDGLPLMYVRSVMCRVDKGDWYPVTASHLQRGIGKPRRVRTRYGQL